MFYYISILTHIAAYLEAIPINIYLGENAKLIAVFQLKFQAESIYLTKPLDEMCFEKQMF